MSSGIPAPLAERRKLYKVGRIQGKDDTKNFLMAQGFIPGADVMIINELAGSIVFRINNSKISLSQEMASRIFVEY